MRRKKRKKLVGKEIKPFNQPRSIIAQVFQMCLQGTTIADIVGLVESKGGRSNRVLRLLRRGTERGYSWVFEEQSGKVRIHSVRLD